MISTLQIHLDSGTPIGTDTEGGYHALDLSNWDDNFKVTIFISGETIADKIAVIDNLAKAVRDLRAALTEPRPSLVSLHGGMSASAPTERGDE